MNTQKYLTYIVIALIVILAFGGFLVYRSLPKDATQVPSGENGSPFGSGGETIPPPPPPPGSVGEVPEPSPGTPLEVDGADGKKVIVANFKGAPGVYSKQNGDYLIHDTGVASTSYEITFYAADESFNVVLFMEPLGLTRKVAEERLMQLLQLGKIDMCRLRYSVYVPIRVSEFYAATNLGFSFCPSAVKLPE